MEKYNEELVKLYLSCKYNHKNDNCKYIDNIIFHGNIIIFYSMSDPYNASIDERRLYLILSIEVIEFQIWLIDYENTQARNKKRDEDCANEKIKRLIEDEIEKNKIKARLI